ncbi:Receptor-type tyrosine-protein phosphatase eta-like 2, partial [Homarus americanus]
FLPCNTFLPLPSSSSTTSDFVIGRFAKWKLSSASIFTYRKDFWVRLLDAKTTGRIFPSTTIELRLREDDNWLSVTWDPTDLSGEGYKVCVLCQRDDDPCNCGNCMNPPEKITNETTIKFQTEPSTNYSVWLTPPDALCNGNGSDVYSLTTNHSNPREPNVTYNRETSPVLSWETGCPYIGPVKYTLLIDGVEFKIHTNNSCNYEAKIMEKLSPATRYNYTLNTQIPDCVEEINRKSVEGSGSSSTPSMSDENESYNGTETPGVGDNPASICYDKCGVCGQGTPIITPPNNPSSRMVKLTWNDPVHAGVMDEFVLKLIHKENVTKECYTPFFTGPPMFEFKNGDEFDLHKEYPILIDSNTFSNDNGEVACWLTTGHLLKRQDLQPTTHPFYQLHCNLEHLHQQGFPKLQPVFHHRWQVDLFLKLISLSYTQPVNWLTVVFSLILAVLLVVVLSAVSYYWQRFLPMKRSESLDIPMVESLPPDVSMEHRITLSQLANTVHKLLSNCQMELKREYALLKSVSPSKPCEYANLPSNKVKNRYINILPFDESRGYNKSREFIACQGPTDDTIEDFWRMVWEKNVHIIVMVTQCVEKNTRKCAKYWPDKEEEKGLVLRQAMLRVTMLHQASNQGEGYIIRKFKLSRIPNYSSRIVQHFHFVSWPDMGCPDTPNHLINLVEAVRKAVPSSSSHVLVHCSAGVGRTGTFIGLNNMIDEIAEEDSVDVFHTVYKMRMHRTNMVQTEAQYAFLYKCVLKYYNNKIGETETEIFERNRNQPRDIPDVITNTPEARNSSPETESDDTSSKTSTHDSAGVIGIIPLYSQLSETEYIEDKDLEPHSDLDDEEDKQLIKESPEPEDKSSEH